MKGVSVGYLPQDGLSLSGRTVFAECMTVFADLLALEAGAGNARAQAWPSSIPPAPNTPQVADRFHRAEGEFRARDGYRHRGAGGHGALRPGISAARMDQAHRRVLRRLADAHRAGQAAARKAQPAAARRAHQSPGSGSPQLAGRLSGNPTRTPSCWSRTTAIFWTSPCARSLELWNKGVHFYTGGYSRYEQQKTERRAQLEAAYANQQDRIEQLEAFINRFRYQATKAKQVQSRIKELEKIERIEIPPEEKTIHFRFPQPKPSGRIVAEFKNVAKSYGDQAVFARRGLHHRARRPHRAGGRERRGEIDADQDAGGRGAAHLRRIHPGPQRPARLLRAGSVQGARPERAHARRSWHGRAARHQHRAAQHSGLLPVLRGRRVQDASACSRAASATATRWPAC